MTIAAFVAVAVAAVVAVVDAVVVENEEPVETVDLAVASSSRLGP